MTNHHGKLILALCLALGATACDQSGDVEAPAPTFRGLGGVGTGSGLTLNTNQWVSSSARDIYEFSLQGDWHTNSYGYESKLVRISLADSPYGPVSTPVGAPHPPGEASVAVLPGDDFRVEVIKPGPGNPPVELQGDDLIGLRLDFIVRGYDGVAHEVAIGFTDHLEHATAGDFYRIMKMDPETGEPLAPLCEEDSDGYRMARIYDGLSVDAQTGEMDFVGEGIHHVACSSSAPGKAVLFGYNPTQLTVEAFILVNRVVRADYCADGHPYTYPGNLVGIEDNFTGSGPTTIAEAYASLGEDEVIEAVWDENGVLCMDTPRASNVEREDVICPIKEFTNGTVEYNWRPPQCSNFVDPNPAAMRYFSKGSI